VNTRYVMGSTMRTAGLVLCALAVSSWVFYGALAREPGRNVTLEQGVQSIWQQADGPIAAGDIQRSWVWGPQPLAQSVEYYSASPEGTRTLVYFDKARLDVLDANADRNSPWYATGALLVSEMLAGQAQLDVSGFVSRPVPQIPLAGDMDQANPVTYATLAPHSTFAEGNQSAGNAVGFEITAVLNASGDVDPEGMLGSGIAVGGYSDATGRNVAEPFVTWANSLPYPDLYLLGHPVSEPYWIETQVLGTSKMVLVQAFERRVMTYTPDIPAEWMVESANVGQHYRLWRGLAQPANPNLAPLASGESFGEELVSVAMTNGIDPYMFVAISQVVSGGNPFAETSNGHGLLGVKGDQLDFDPLNNARAGAKVLGALLPAGPDIDWPVVLAAYYGSSAEVDATIELYDALGDKYSAEMLALASADANPATFGGPLSSGPVAYYDPSYTTDWWEWALTYYQGLGLVAPNWSNDPSGYYCVRPGYIPGERLRVHANGRTVDCTVGDMVADRDLGNWLSKWSIEMNWPMFVALGLDQHNYATVEYPGNTPKPPPPVVVVPQSPSFVPGPPPVQPAPGGPSYQNPGTSGSDPVAPAPPQPAPPPPPVVAPVPPTSVPVPDTEPAPSVPTEPAPDPVAPPPPPVVEAPPAPPPPPVVETPSGESGASSDPLPPSR
jgi:hypothetical protein